MQDEVIGEWTLSIDELSFVLDHRKEVHLAKAVVLKRLQLRGAYPGEAFVLDEEIIEYLSHQAHRPRQDYDAIAWTNRKMRRQPDNAPGGPYISTGDGQKARSALNAGSCPSGISLQVVKTCQRFRDK